MYEDMASARSCCISDSVASGFTRTRLLRKRATLFGFRFTKNRAPRSNSEYAADSGKVRNIFQAKIYAHPTRLSFMLDRAFNNN